MKYQNIKFNDSDFLEKLDLKKISNSSSYLKKSCVIVPSYLKENGLETYLDEFLENVNNMCCKKCSFILKDPYYCKICLNMFSLTRPKTLLPCFGA